jgi:RNA polymerase sigma factor (sigma-70 family)
MGGMISAGRRPPAGPAVARAAASLITANARRVTRALGAGARHGTPGSDADQAVAVLYDTHYHPLIRLAALLVSDAEIAEEIVQDAFVAMHGDWRRLGNCEQALPYLQKAVIRRSRSRCADRQDHDGPPDMPTHRQPAIAAQTDLSLAAALRALPAHAREVLVLRYYAGWTGAQIADAIGIDARSVNSYLANGMPAFQAVLAQEPPAPPPSGAEAGLPSGAEAGPPSGAEAGPADDRP